ncbi:MAG: hypothetical protein Q8P95_01775 [bacterium]|nr:hypothetical protein [bacterium]
MASKIDAIQQMITSAEASLRSAKKLLLELSGEDVPEGQMDFAPAVSSSSQNPNKVIEGIFNGEQMVAGDGEAYPVPANYASKSKLVAGDQLKLSIMPDGKLMYKQIGPAPRKSLMGTLVNGDGQYKVLAGKRTYKVLLASVTYYKGKVGDNVTVTVPASDDSDWAAIEAVLPSDVKELNVNEEEPEEEVEF